MKCLLMAIRDHSYDFLLWLAITAMGLLFPIYSAFAQLPSTQLIQKNIIERCPAVQIEKCMATADLLQAVGSFYETVIIVLLALLALVASLVYLSIKSFTKRQIEAQFEKDFESKWVQERVREKVENEVSAAIAEYAKRVEILEGVVKRLNLSDQSEERVAETDVLPHGEKGDG